MASAKKASAKAQPCPAEKGEAYERAWIEGFTEALQVQYAAAKTMLLALGVKPND